MKKKLCSLVIALVLLLSCVLGAISVEAELAVLTPIEFFQDFNDESILVGSNYTGEEIEQMTNVPMQLKSAPTISASIVEEESGNKVLRLIPTVAANEIDSLYVLDNALAGGKLEASFEFAPESASQDAWHFFMLTDSEGREEPVISYNNGVWIKTNSTTEGTLLSNPQKNTNGRYVLRLEVSRTSSSGAWTVKVFDDSGIEPVLRYEGKTAEDFKAVAKVKPIRLYAVAAVAATFDNYLIRATYFPVVLEGDDGLSGVSPLSTSMTVGFNAALPKADDKVTFVKASDPETVIRTQTTYDSETGRLTINPKSYLEYGTEYVMLFESGGVTNHSFTTAQKPLSVEEKAVLYTPNGGSEIADKPQEGIFKAKLNIKISNTTNSEKPVTVVFAAYDEDGAIVEAKTRNINIPANYEAFPTNVTINNLDATEVSYFKTFVWENDSVAGYIPLLIS